MNKLDISVSTNQYTGIENDKKYPNTVHLYDIPKREQTYELVKSACTDDGLLLQYVSKRLINEELCEISVLQNGMALKYVPAKLLSSSLCEEAISNNGRALEFVPDDMRTENLCMNAVKYYVYMPPRNPFEEDSSYLERCQSYRELAKKGVTLLGNQDYPIKYVPECFLTNELIYESVKYAPMSLRDIPDERITIDLAEFAITLNSDAFKHVPKTLQTEELVNMAISNDPQNIRYIVPELITKKMCEKVFCKDILTFPYYPEQYVTVKMCKKIIHKKKLNVINTSVFHKDGFIYRDHSYGILFEDFPDKMRNSTMILDQIIREYGRGAIDLYKWNQIISDKAKENIPMKNIRGSIVKPLNASALEYLRAKFDLMEDTISDINISKIKSYIKEKNELIISQNGETANKLQLVNQQEMVLHVLSDAEETENIYYISDLHIEHQLFDEAYRIMDEKKDVPSVLWYEEFKKVVEQLIDKRIASMVAGKKGFLLVAGDVADSLEWSKLFYDRLRKKWMGYVISVLGNHELWDGTTEENWCDPKYKSRSIEQIVQEYKSYINSHFIENDLLIYHKNCYLEKLTEQQVHNIKDGDLKEIIDKSSLVVLGGIGYSGLNEHENAERGLYRKALISRDEDRQRSKRFFDLYSKVKKCAQDKQVIVLTHNPISDWCPESPNPKWIYVNGHTHKNIVRKEKNGVTIFSDNQVGYQPKDWKLNGFSTRKLWYDPFESYKDGIYQITSEQYEEFNMGRGFGRKGCKHEGTIYALKREGMYMFVIQSSTSLCLLVGGARKGLDYDIDYYYDNMTKYSLRVKDMIRPYKKVIEQISEEVMKIGGLGFMHGCIVDISYYSHIYLNPYDGKITPYWALDTNSRLTYDNIELLIQDKEPDLLELLTLQISKHQIPLIEKYMLKNNNCLEQVAIPEWVFGTEMYEPSRIMRKIQYVWEQNVIRIWNDDILDDDYQMHKCLKSKKS